MEAEPHRTLGPISLKNSGKAGLRLAHFHTSTGALRTKKKSGTPPANLGVQACGSQAWGGLPQGGVGHFLTKPLGVAVQLGWASVSTYLAVKKPCS